MLRFLALEQEAVVVYCIFVCMFVCLVVCGFMSFVVCRCFSVFLKLPLFSLRSVLSVSS